MFLCLLSGIKGGIFESILNSESVCVTYRKVMPSLKETFILFMCHHSAVRMVLYFVCGGFFFNLIS